ncbi:MAG: glucoamylase family protein, partial [Candidatus Omnitrophota bacterium]
TLASDSWLYFKNLINKDTHLPVDWIDLDETKEYRIGDYTSPTNIGLYFLSIVGAYDLNLIVREEAVKRAENTLNTLKKLPRWRGLYYNWYSTTNLQITRRYISTVDNGWLSAGLIVLRQVFPEVYSLCSEILEEMDYSTLYDPVEGKLYLGYELNRDPPVPTPYHYGQIATEPRVTSLIAIGKGDVSEDHWFRIFRTLPQSWTWQRQIPQGKYREYLEIDVFEGYYTYKDLKIVPSWGGSLFEFLMPVLVLKEKELAPRSLGLNNFNVIKAHIDYALNEKKYPVWGLSPCATPDGRYGGYHEYGLASLGAKGYPDEGIITPYASILAIDYFPEEVVKNIHELMKNFDLYGEYGMYDSVDVHTQKVASRYLCLDQAMIFVSLVNYLTNGKIREYFHQDQIIKNVESLLKMEEFF